MNPLDKQWLYRGFHKQLRVELGSQKAEAVWREAGQEYVRILTTAPAMKRHKGEMALPAVALYRVLEAQGTDAEKLLNTYGDCMGRRFAGIVHGITSIPGVSRLIWRHVAGIMERMSSQRLGYRRRIVSEPPDLYGVDILSCPYHELAKELGDERAVLCICHMDKEYSQGFRHIRYDRNSAVSEGARACEYRLRFDPKKA